jgi:hypothetical protein
MSKKTFKLSDQAITSIAMTLQKAIVEQLDITEIMRGFIIENTEDGLVIKNPPQPPDFTKLLDDIEEED